MKIAVPTEATAGTTIATQPIRIARIPTVISAFQLRRSPSRTSGSICTPLISIVGTLSALADAIDRSESAALWHRKSFDPGRVARLGARSGVV